MQKTNYKKPLYSLISLILIVFSLLIAVHFWSFNKSFYRSEHSKLKLYGKSISEHIGISEEDLDYLTSFTLDYLNDPNASLDLKLNIKGEMREVYNQTEKMHMIDVRNLNLLANHLIIVFGIIILVFIVYLYLNKDYELFFKQYRSVLKYSFIFFGILIIWIIIDFDSFWTMFHHVFFAGNDLWLLDLNKDVLIMIVPPEFFFHLVSIIVVTFIIILVLIYLLLYFICRKSTIND